MKKEFKFPRLKFPKLNVWHFMIALLMLCFSIFTYIYEKELKRTVKVVVQVTDENSLPIEALEVELKDDTQSTAIKESSNGKFTVKNVRYHQLEDSLNLRIRLVDQSFHDVVVGYKYDKTNKVITLDLVKIKSTINLTNEFDNADPSLLAEYIPAIVNTIYHPLTLRDSPSLYGRKLGSIPKNAQVEIQYYATEEVTINGKRGRWCFVQYNNESGYVFGGYLLEQSTL